MSRPAHVEAGSGLSPAKEVTVLPTFSRKGPPPATSLVGGWTVSVRLATGPAYRIGPGTREMLTKVMARRGPVLSEGPSDLHLIFGVEGDTPAEAQQLAQGLIEEVLFLLGLDQPGLVSRVAVVSNESLGDDLVLPVVLGASEVADVLGISTQRVGQLSAQPDFPVPLFRLRATPVWLESDVRRYAVRRSLHPASAPKIRRSVVDTPELTTTTG